jgi:hypothetical protein
MTVYKTTMTSSSSYIPTMTVAEGEDLQPFSYIFFGIFLYFLYKYKCTYHLIFSLALSLLHITPHIL